MRIGMNDDMCLGLELELIRQGHTLLRYLPVMLSPEDVKYLPDTKAGSTDPADYDYIGAYRDSIVYCQSFEHLIAEKPDLCVVDGKKPAMYRRLCWEGIPTIGYSSLWHAAEKDRCFSARLAEACGMKVPQAWSCKTKQEAIERIEQQQGKVVLKGDEQYRGNSDFRTVVPQTPDDLIYFLEGTSSFDRQGSILLLEKIEGIEVGFGAWFNGQEFLPPYYVDFEHKVACNANRSGVLTGEVGTLLFHDFDLTLKAWKVMTRFAGALREQGTFHGLLDVNCILTPSGDLYFLEFTSRFGKPTLELVLSQVAGDVGDMLYNVASGSSSPLPLLTDFVCGVCAFTYGMPLADSSDVFPMPLVHGIEQAHAHADVRMLDVTIQHKDKVRAHWNSRSLVVNGCGASADLARQRAYDGIKHINYWGMTYRDDVSESWDRDRYGLLEHGYINRARFGKTE